MYSNIKFVIIFDFIHQLDFCTFLHESFSWYFIWEKVPKKY